jgi:hypothetical protein
MFEQIEILERWLPVVGHEGYEVSNWGRVRSIARTLDCGGNQQRGHVRFYKGRLLSPWIVKSSGYLNVSIYSKKFHIAHLVAEAWIGPRPGGFQIDHKDGNKQNNCVWNLRYVTPKENTNAGNYTRQVARGKKNGKTKLSDADVIEIRRLKIEGMTYKEIAKMFNVNSGYVRKIALRKVRVK